MKMANEKQARTLELLKAYYEDFYNKNAAVNPAQVNSIKYFLDWLKDTATADDISVNVVESSIRNCELNLKVEYFFSYGENNYSSHYTSNGTVTALVCDNQQFVNYFTDVYLSPEANSKVVPGCIYEIAKEEGKKALYNNSSSKNVVFSDATILSYNISDPMPNEFWSCVISYPHPVADKAGNTVRSFSFIVWKDKVYFGNYGGPADVSGKEPGGCYVATCVYGSYDCPEVWTLRRYRDNTLGSTWYGRAFIKLYYAISPTLVKWFGQTDWFKKMWKGTLDHMVKKLNDKGVEDTPYKDKNWK